ncbi:MAG: RagB/SusD family nutrient uptake outer membrane protein [Prolixibacteraceae bacterium]
MKIINWTYSRGLFALLLSVIVFTSCEKYIDIDEYVYDKTTIDSIFTSKTKTFEYINGTAAYLKNESNFVGDWDAKTPFPSGMASDEAIQPWVNGDHAGSCLVVDQVTPRDTRNANIWPDYYRGIRKANIILARIDGNPELTDSEMRDYKGLAYFLRAYFYYSLVRMYGPVPILPDEPFDTDATVESVSFERSSYDDCVEYICANLEEAAQLLPRDRALVFQYMPTRGAAMALIARMRLYSASPLYNGNTFYANWKRTDGTPFISQTADPERWGKAAAAFKRIIDLGKYQLLTTPKIVNTRGTGTLELPDTSDPNLKTQSFPNGAADIDPYKSYKSVFDGSVTPESNPELIYFSREANINMRFAFPPKQGGNTTLSVPKDVVDQFRMADGRLFSEATDEEKSWQAVGTGHTFSEDYTLSADRAKMDDNREPRYYASIGFNYCFWPGTAYVGTTAGVINFTATYYKDGTAYGTDYNYNRTGYTIRKWAHQEDNRDYWGAVKPKTYPIVRYAEVLLGYVEAMNEMNGSYTDEASGVTVTKDVNQMVKYFNEIRYRAGLPGITAAEAGDYDTMKSLIKHERQIEFFFEDHRYYDLRRWMDAPEVMRTPVNGLDVSAKTAERQRFYTTKIWNTETAMKRVWNNKMYFYPIDQSVLDKNGKLVQSPGWN